MTIQHLRSSTANKRPTPAAMSDGQIAVNTNTASPGLFFKDSAGALIKVGPVHVGTTAPNASPASGGETGNTVGEQWLDTTGGTYVFKVWDGSAWRSETGTFVDVNGDVMTGALGIIAGSAGSPGLYFSGDPNTGIYSPGADQVAISTNGTKRIEIQADGDIDIDNGGVFYDATNNRLAIGTTSPARTLHVAGSAVFADTVDTTVWAQFSTGVGGIGTNNNYPFAFAINGTERARIDSSGRLLVGTSSTSSASALVVQNNSSGNGVGVVRINYSTNSPGANDTLGIVSFGDNTHGEYASVAGLRDGGTWSGSSKPTRLVFSTTADGASSPTEQMRIKNDGVVIIGPRTAFNYHTVSWNGSAEGTNVFGVTDDGTNQGSAYFKLCSGGGENAANCAIQVKKNSGNNRSINAAGTINASGADYAEYMVKAGDFSLAKGSVCGVTADGLLTLDYADAVSFVVKSTNPSYVGGDTWGSEDVVGKKPEDGDTEALAQWEANLEAARQQVDRIAFAGQVPVNVTGATPGQYIVPVEAADGGIEGVAKNEADLTLAEYMRAVGKVIAIEDDGRARIIVKVA